MNKEMTAEKLLKIYRDLEDMGIRITLDGGWGVDALLGKQTRLHKDIDFLTERKDLSKVKSYFANKGYVLSESEPADERHFVLEGPDGIADIHVIEFDDRGKALYVTPGKESSFPREAFKGTGTINGVKVRALTPEFRIECLTRAYGVVVRTGYVLSEKDYKDLSAISEKFDIPMPQEYLDDMFARDIEL